MHLRRDDDTLPTFVILAFAVYRITRFLIHDTLIEKQRLWVYRKIAKAVPAEGGGYRIPEGRTKLLELLQCPWCLSIWIAAGTVFAASRRRSIPLPVIYFPALGGAAVYIWDHIDGS